MLLTSSLGASLRKSMLSLLSSDFLMHSRYQNQKESVPGDWKIVQLRGGAICLRRGALC